MKKIFALLFALLPLFLAAQTDNFDEDPYFILCGEADRAIAAQEYTEAAARLLDAISLKPDEPQTVLLMSNLGMVYSYMDNDSLALATLNKALQRAPSMKTVLANRGKVLLKMGHDLRAQDDFAKIIAADSLNREARYFHGMIGINRRNLVQAEEDFEILANNYPDHHDTAIALSTLYSLTGREQKALEYLKKLLAEDPQPEYYAAMADCRLVLGHLPEAAEIISEGIAKYPTDPELYICRARFNRDRYLPEEARRDARKAVELGYPPVLAQKLFEK